MDIGVVVLVVLFAGIAWQLLRSKPGKPLVCTSCGHYGPTRSHTKGSLLIELVLYLFVIVPGLIYSIWRLSTRQRVCQACGSAGGVPADTPVGRRILAEQTQEQID